MSMGRRLTDDCSMSPLEDFRKSIIDPVFKDLAEQNGSCFKSERDPLHRGSLFYSRTTRILRLGFFFFRSLISLCSARNITAMNPGRFVGVKPVKRESATTATSHMETSGERESRDGMGVGATWGAGVENWGLTNWKREELRSGTMRMERERGCMSKLRCVWGNSTCKEMPSRIRTERMGSFKRKNKTPSTEQLESYRCKSEPNLNI